LNNVIIFGSGSNGRIAYRESLMSDDFNFICFADDSLEKQKNGVDGQKVLSVENAILECKAKNIVPIIAIENYHFIRQKIESAGLRPIIYRYKSSSEIIRFKELILNKIVQFLEKNEVFIKYLLFPIATFMWAFNYRIAKNFRFTGFGHIAMEPAVAVANPDWQKYKIVLLVDGYMCPNIFLLSLWRKYFTIISHKFLFHLLAPLQSYDFISVDFQLNDMKYRDRYLLITDENSTKRRENIIKDAYLKKFPSAYKKLISYLKKMITPLL